MRCPDCNKEVGNVAYCPYCGATISNNNSSVSDITNNDTPIITIDKDTKPLFNKAFVAFGISVACIVIWYLCTNILSSLIGEFAKIAFTYNFGKMLVITIIIGLLTSIALAYSNKIRMFPQKLTCIIICIVSCIISYLLLAIIGETNGEIPRQLASAGKRALNFYFAFCMPLTCGSIFISSISTNKKKSITTLIIALLTIVLSCAISFITISIFAMALNGLFISCIVPIIVFVISMLSK